MSEAGQMALLRGLGQMAAAGGVGAAVVLLGSQVTLALAFAGGGGGAALAMVAVAIGGMGLLVLVASVTRDASLLTRTAGGRIGWAVLVTVLGAGGCLLGWAIGDAAGLGFTDSMAAWVPLSAIPFALVAGLLLRKWYLALGSFGLIVVGLMGLLDALADSVPNRSEAEERLAAVNRERGDYVVTEIPGYHVLPQTGGWQMEPDDPAAIPARRYITLYTSLDNTAPDCAPDQRSSEFMGATCTVERPGLAYLKAVTDHGYTLRVGTTLLEIIGSSAVDRAALRDAIVAAVPSDDPTIYTVTIPGYTGMKTGMRPGMSYQPTDPGQLPDGKHVEVRIWPGTSTGQCAAFANSAGPSPYLECDDEPGGLFYQRLADKHLYLRPDGGKEIQVIGGLGVDRNVLRDAAIAARPPTDHELMTMLPPVPPKPRTFMDSLKIFAKKVMG